MKLLPLNNGIKWIKVEIIILCKIHPETVDMTEKWYCVNGITPNKGINTGRILTRLETQHQRVNDVTPSEGINTRLTFL